MKISYYIAVSIVSIFWAILIVYSALYYLPYNTLSKNITKKETFLFLFPQGWKFFTKDPTEPNMRLYDLSNNTISEVNMKNASVSNLMGLSREARVLSVELGSFILPQISDTLWKTVYIKKSLRYQDLDSLKINLVTIDNKSHLKKICGKYLVDIDHVIPWAWASNNRKKIISRKKELIRVVISCE